MRRRRRSSSRNDRLQRGVTVGRPVAAMTPSPLSGLRRLAVDAGIVILSGIMWDGLWLLNKLVMSHAIVTTGISLVFLPAGFRLLIILLFGGWGALGIFLSEPLLYFREFGTGSLPQVMVTAAISAFSPWIVTQLFCRAMGIRRSLDGLRPLHLPLLALLLSLVTPLLFNVLFVATGLHPAADFLRDYSAMAAGDFLGCVIVIGAIKLIGLAARAAR